VHFQSSLGKVPGSQTNIVATAKSESAGTIPKTVPIIDLRAWRFWSDFQLLLHYVIIMMSFVPGAFRTYGLKIEDSDIVN